MGYYRVLITSAFRDVIILSPIDPLCAEITRKHKYLRVITTFITTLMWYYLFCFSTRAH
jgi:hypothetical protein